MRPHGNPQPNTVHILVLHKGEQRYAFIFTRPLAKRLLGVFDSMAVDPQIDFSWRDNTLLRNRVKAEIGE